MPLRLAILSALLAALVAAPQAAASIKGPCSARIATVDVAGWRTGPLDDAVPVPQNTLVPVSMSANSPITRLKVELEFAGVRWAVHDRPTNGTSWSSEVPVEDYTLYGLGLYKVVASSVGRGFTCEGTVLIRVDGDDELDPLTTIAGLSGFGLALLGALGVLAIAGRVGKSRAAPFSGLLLGAILGVGIAVLLQQFSAVYPTISVAGFLIAGCAALGLGFSLFGLPGREGDAR